MLEVDKPLQLHNSRPGARMRTRLLTRSQTFFVIIGTIAAATLAWFLLLDADGAPRSGAYANDAPGRTSVDHHFTIGITCPFAPMFANDNRNIDGTQWILITDAFAKIGLVVQPIFMNYEDALHAFETGLTQGLWLCGGMKLPENGFFVSTPLLPWNFVVLTLKDRGVSVDGIAALAQLQTGIHPDVFLALHKDVSLKVLSNPNLKQVSNHVLLETMLFSGKIDALITEPHVFEYYRRSVPSLANPDQAVVSHHIFDPVYPVIVFNEKEIRDKFNTSWEAIVNNMNTQ